MDTFHSFSSFSSLPTDDLLYGQPSTSSLMEHAEAPVSEAGTAIIKKKRGRPRKIATTGEEQIKKQVTVRKKRKHTNKSTEVYTQNCTRWQESVYWLTGDDVNTRKMYLPEGWKCFATKRFSGIHKGSYDLIYMAPNGYRLRSRNELHRWAINNNSDINPSNFLFNRTRTVLMDKDNAKNIIFRNAAPKGKSQKFLDPPNTCGISEAYNTVLTEGGRELLLDNGGMDNQSDLSSNAQQHSFQGNIEGNETTPTKEEQSSSTPKKVKKLPKPRRVPLDKTLDCLKSPYFALKNQVPLKPVSIRAIHTSKWIPPRSPFNLIQEDLYHNPWQLLIATIFLNCTTGKLAIPVIHEFLARWPSPHEACCASLFDILEVVQLLGLGRTRSATIIRFSHEYLTVDWKKPTELFGIGKYGNDSYKVFCLGQWRTVESEDKYLNMYINWLHNACSRSSNAYR